MSVSNFTHSPASLLVVAMHKDGGWTSKSTWQLRSWFLLSLRLLTALVVGATKTALRTFVGTRDLTCDTIAHLRLYVLIEAVADRGFGDASQCHNCDETQHQDLHVVCQDINVKRLASDVDDRGCVLCRLADALLDTYMQQWWWPLQTLPSR